MGVGPLPPPLPPQNTIQLNEKYGLQESSFEMKENFAYSQHPQKQVKPGSAVEENSNSDDGAYVVI